MGICESAYLMDIIMLNYLLILLNMGISFVQYIIIKEEFYFLDVLKTVGMTYLGMGIIIGIVALLIYLTELTIKYICG